MISPLRRRLAGLLHAYLDHGLEKVEPETALSMRRARGFALVGLLVFFLGGVVSGLIVRSPAGSAASLLTMLFIVGAVWLTSASNGRFHRPATHASIGVMMTLTIGASIELGYASPLAVTSSVVIIMATCYILGVRASIFWTGVAVCGVGYAVLTSEPIPLPEGAIRPSLPVIFASRALALMGTCAIAVMERRFSDRQSRKLVVLASHDALTGLLNRRAFGERLEQAIARARRHGRRVGLIFLDLDRFKRVNDEHGHAAGDDVLRDVGRRIASITRESDSAGRAGGDEFVVLLEDVSEVKHAEIFAGRLLARIRGEPDPSAEPGSEVRASVGVACFPDDGDGTDSLMKAADLAMYRAKSDGGNAVRTPS
jgi:diguanylate cyclase (GGDEF)-like protein